MWPGHAVLQRTGIFVSGVSAMKVKAVVARIAELHPLAVLTPCSSCSLNICLANTMTFTGVHLVMSTLKKLDAFFSKSSLLQNQLESAILIYYQGEEKASFLKEACYSNGPSSMIHSK